MHFGSSRNRWGFTKSLGHAQFGIRSRKFSKNGKILGKGKMTTINWKTTTYSFILQNFSRISSELLIKQQILQKLNTHQIGISSNILELTPLELRLSIFVKPQDKTNIENDSTLNCRVCLQFSDRMSYIFEETHNEITLAEKMSRCANVSMVI